MNLGEMVSEMQAALYSQGYHISWYDCADVLGVVFGKCSRTELFEDEYLRIELERLRIQREVKHDKLRIFYGAGHGSDGTPQN